MGFHALVNTQYFKEAAIDFKKNGGKYTKAPRGSRDYREYWEEQDKRCLYGYQVGDLWIPGKQYFFLNFTPMSRIPAEKMALLRAGGDMAGVVKHTDFPSFTEVHYEWSMFKHIAWYGGEFMGITSKGGQHICALKTRRAGWSYWEAGEGAYNYNFIPKSKSFYFAGLEDYLTKDGILNKVQDDLNWINDHSRWWKKNRQKKNTLMHQKASLINSFGEEEGYQSEIMGVIVNDPDKVRGKNGIKITYEEGGSFKHLLSAYGVSRGTVEDSGGSITTGQITVLGTGGEEGPDIMGLTEMWENPSDYNMISFPNIWEPGMENEQVGYFVPVHRMDYKHMDDDGNVDVEGAFMEQMAIRSKIKNPNTLDSRKAEYPVYPSEALMRSRNNYFWGERIDKQIKLLRSGVLDTLQVYGRYFKGTESGRWEFRPQKRSDANPIMKFPHTHSENLKGCVTVWDPPYKDNTGKTPRGIYKLVFDPYYLDDAEDKTSLFAAYVIKLHNPYELHFAELPVASYVGRPDKLEYVYEQIFAMALDYNCTMQGEAGGGGKGVLDYAGRPDIQLKHLIDFEPVSIINGKENNTALKNRSYLMSMPEERKWQGLTYLVEWHKRPRGLDPDGNTVYNVDRIYDLPLLLEMKKFHEKGNFDRISALIIAQYCLKEAALSNRKPKEEKKDSFFNRQLFPSESSSSGQIITALS